MHWANHSAESLNHWSWSWSSNKNTMTTNEKKYIRFHLVVMESCMCVIAARFHTIWIIVNGTSGIGSNLLKKRFPFDLSFVSFIVFLSIYFTRSQHGTRYTSHMHVNECSYFMSNVSVRLCMCVHISTC